MLLDHTDNKTFYLILSIINEYGFRIEKSIHVHYHFTIKKREIQFRENFISLVC